MKCLLGAGILAVLTIAAQTPTAESSVAAWHGGAPMMLRSYGYVGALVEGRFFPARPLVQHWLLPIREDSAP
jgi:predicted choloylglycine hydrolase